MDSYLEIAQHVLRSEKRPMTPKGIIKAAFRMGIVPPHLHGSTQHKTLGARISEDILRRRDQSAFFRTKPGRFFMREYLFDESLPEQHRTPFSARRRLRDFSHGPYLYARQAVVASRLRYRCQDGEKLHEMIADDCFFYVDDNIASSEKIQVWSFVCVVKQNNLLCYRQGRYRDDRDNFVFKRSIGFKSKIRMQDSNLFNNDTLGIIDAGVSGAVMDLDIPFAYDGTDAKGPLANLEKVIFSSEADHPALLAVVLMRCPEWFEPLNRRLALNDLTWLNLSCRVNDIDDFDPWSKAVLQCVFYPVGQCDDESYQDFGCGE